MNAVEQATTLAIASKIASIVNLFKSDFPDIRADLKPWINDPDTRAWVDPDSIDLGFHFPGRSRLFQCRSLLVQIRLYKQEAEVPRAIGVEIAGFDHQGKQWWFSTIGAWEFGGAACPVPDRQERLKQFCQQILDLFNTGETL